MKITARIGYLVSEGMRSLRTHLLLTTMTSLTIAVALVLFGLFTALYHGIDSTAVAFHSQLRIVVFLEDGISSPQLDALRRWLGDRPEVGQVTYTDKATALARFAERQPDAVRLVDLLGANPLPASLEAQLAEDAHSATAVETLAERVAGFAGVDSVRYGKEWMAGLLGLSRWVRIVGVGLGLLMFAATVFIVSNSVRLSVYARRDEIAIMRLIGATHGFIRAPFYLEGAVAGVLGGILAAAILTALHGLGGYLLAPVVDGGFLLSEFSLPLLARGHVAALAAAGVFLGLVGCWTSLGRFLRE
ncbi:MAG: permease-like cell division protein FtsX [Nitrospirota bacterium]